MRKLQFVLIMFLCIMAVHGMPDSDHYYVNVPTDEHSASVLFSLIGNSRFSIPYEFGTFDCSEMSAYLDWFLKSHGFKTSICVGSIPYSGEIDHAWLKAEVTVTGNDNETVYIDGADTFIRICEPGMMGYDSYNRPVLEFGSIFDLVNNGWSENEFNWWNNVLSIPYGCNMTVNINATYTIISKSDFPDLST